MSRSAVRARSSALFFVPICRENHGTRRGLGAEAGANLPQPAEEALLVECRREGRAYRFDVPAVPQRAHLFYQVSGVGFDGMIYRLGGADQLYGRVTKVTDGDTITIETQGRSTPVRLIGVDTPETVAPDQLIGCFGPRASDYTKRILAKRIVRLEIPRIGDSEDAYGRTLAYVYLDANGDGEYEYLYNEDLIEPGLARTTDFSHAHRREFERLREEAEARGAGLWSACPEARNY
jgi:endonuclease YncB( thermonuclease family)